MLFYTSVSFTFYNEKWVLISPRSEVTKCSILTLTENEVAIVYNYQLGITLVKQNNKI